MIYGWNDNLIINSIFDEIMNENQSLIYFFKDLIYASN